MKTLRLIGMAIIAVMMSVNFAACGDDDEEGNLPTIGTAKDLVGRWTLTWTKGWEINSEGARETWDEEDSGEDFIFQADGTGWKATPYTQYPSFTWKFENNNFTWNYDFYQNCTVKIIQLDSENLIFEITENNLDSQEINTYRRVSSIN